MRKRYRKSTEKIKMSKATQYNPIYLLNEPLSHQSVFSMAVSVAFTIGLVAESFLSEL